MKIALFITHAAAESMELASKYIEESKSMINDTCDLLGVFNCQGELSEQIGNYMMQSDNPQLRKFAEARKFTIGQPDTERVKKSARFAEKIISELM